MRAKVTCALSALFVLSFGSSGQQPWKLLGPADTKKVHDGYFALLSKAKTIHIVEEYKNGKVLTQAEYWLMKPNMRCMVKGTYDPDKIIHNSVQYMLKDAVYDINVLNKTYQIFRREPGSPFINGVEPYVSAKRPAFLTTGKVYEGLIGDKPFYRIETGEQSIPGSMVSVFVDKDTYTPAGWQYAVAGKGTDVHEYKLFELDKPLTAKDFEWTPPADYKLKADWRKLGAGH